MAVAAPYVEALPSDNGLRSLERFATLLPEPV